MNELKTFQNPEFGEIRIVEVNNEPWFVGKDVAVILGYAKPENAIATHVDIDDKTTTLIQGNGSNYKSKTILINESGLYSLILSSKMPNAKKFKRWVTSEVLPSIRKHGVYMTDQKAYDIAHNPNALADLLLQVGEQLKKKDLMIQEMQPKAIFADAVSASHTSILVGELAKILKQNGVNIGQNRLFSELRERGYLIKRKGSDWNMPTQKSMDMRLFEIKETIISHADGHTSINKTVKVTGTGQQYFINLFVQEKVS